MILYDKKIWGRPSVTASVAPSKDKSIARRGAGGGRAGGLAPRARLPRPKPDVDVEESEEIKATN